MKQHCKQCDIVFDDFNRDTQCPHWDFHPTESAKAFLQEQGICWRCGDRSATKCLIDLCPLRP